jgi:hypothetical protein
MDKLVSDIQQYLQEDAGESQEALESVAVEEAAQLKRRLMPVGLITLLSACAVGSLAVVILMLGLVGSPSRLSADAIWLLGIGACGIFFSAMLISAWKRLVLLAQIEHHIRLILENKRLGNALLEEVIRNMN